MCVCLYVCVWVCVFVCVCVCVFVDHLYRHLMYDSAREGFSATGSVCLCVCVWPQQPHKKLHYCRWYCMYRYVSVNQTHLDFVIVDLYCACVYIYICSRRHALLGRHLMSPKSFKPQGLNLAVSVKRGIAKSPLPLNIARTRLPHDLIKRSIGKSAVARKGPGPGTEHTTAFTRDEANNHSMFIDPYYD